MKRRALVILLLAVAALAVSGGWLWHWHRWTADAPRRASLETLVQLDADLRNPASGHLLDTVLLPMALQGRTPAERLDFIAKALRDEISPEGIAILKKQGQFGPLRTLFPQEAEAWAAQAGVEADACVAFRLAGTGLRAEVVLLKDVGPDAAQTTFRVVRCNNVKQLALPAPISASTAPPPTTN